MTIQIERLASRLDDAACNATAVSQHTEADGLTMENAYTVQRALVDRRLARGHHAIGMKMGFTSRAKMAQMGLSDLIWGRLTSDMRIEEGGSIDARRYVHPRCEPEICFLLGKPLEGEVTPLQAMAAVEAMAPAIELIDSRYENFKFSLADVVADNASSSGLVVGNWHRPDIDCANLGLVLSVNGRAVELGSTAALLGHPVRSLVAAARLASAAGEPLQAGSLVMAGGVTAAIALAAGMHVRCEMQYMGTVSFSVRAQQDNAPSADRS
ncbi:MAG: fumarylacetoacetate hydrolase family protein [Burkholderiaceae bacterium]